MQGRQIGCGSIVIYNECLIGQETWSYFLVFRQVASELSISANSCELCVWFAYFLLCLLMVVATAAAGPSGIFCRGPMKGLGWGCSNQISLLAGLFFCGWTVGTLVDKITFLRMPGTGARIKYEPQGVRLLALLVGFHM